jgi:cytoskeletal protein RodZ
MSDSDTPTPPPAVVATATRAEIVQKIAQTLVERRRERDFTLEKVAQTIKIRLPYLQSIEKGKWDELPGEVYVRGFVIRYAGFLGLDTAALMAPYLASQSPVLDSAPPANTPLSADVNRLQFLWIGLIGIFIVVFIKLIQKERTAPLKPAATVIASSTTARTPAPVAAPVAATTTETPRSVLAKHSLQIYSPWQLWVRVVASDKTFEGFIPQAASWTWKGEGTFNVRLGHTKQVVMSFDGQPVALGDDQKSVILPSHAH